MDCSIDGCRKPARKRGWCEMHYTRWRIHGDPMIVKPRGRRRLDPSPARAATRSSYRAMLSRCFNPKTNGWERYGGRGITVCDRWLGKDGFVRFVADMGDRPEGTTLDRIDSAGNYEPGNCRWSTVTEQNLNRRVPPPLTESERAARHREAQRRYQGRARAKAAAPTS